MELNLSETAFVLLRDKQNEIRWFTPNSEVKLCGHATIAASHILWKENFITKDKIDLNSLSGTISVTKEKSFYTLNFPTQAPIEKNNYSEAIKDILGIDPIFIGSNNHDCVAIVEDEDFVRSFVPDYSKIKKLEERGFLLSAASKSKKYDYIYRGFFPKLSVPEDPVTGSANTLLIPYWSKVLNKNKLKAYQSSKRGGELALENKGERVLISGEAYTAASGELFI